MAEYPLRTHQRVPDDGVIPALKFVCWFEDGEMFIAAAPEEKQPPNSARGFFAFLRRALGAEK